MWSYSFSFRGPKSRQALNLSVSSTFSRQKNITELCQSPLTARWLSSCWAPKILVLWYIPHGLSPGSILHTPTMTFCAKYIIQRGYRTDNRSLLPSSEGQNSTNRRAWEGEKMTKSIRTTEHPRVRNGVVTEETSLGWACAVTIPGIMEAAVVWFAVCLCVLISTKTRPHQRDNTQVWKYVKPHSAWKVPAGQEERVVSRLTNSLRFTNPPVPPLLPEHLLSLTVLSFSFFPPPASQNNLNNSCYLLRIYCLLHINIIFWGMYYYATVFRVRLLAGSLSHYYSNPCMPQAKPILSPAPVLDFRSRKIINTIFRL